MPQFIPFVQFSAPAVSRRPGFGEKLLDTLTGAVVGGAAQIAATKVGTDIRSKAEKENLAYRIAAEQEAELATNWAPLTQEIKDSAAAQNLRLSPRTFQGQEYVSRADLAQLEQREFTREYAQEEVSVPGAGVSGPREEIELGVRAGTLGRMIPASETERQAALDQAKAENEARKRLGLPTAHAELINAIETNQPLSIDDLNAVQQAVVFSYGAAASTAQEIRTRYQFNYNAERELAADVMTMMMGADLVNQEGNLRIPIGPDMARMWLMDTEEKQQMYARGWRVMEKKAPIDLGEYINNVLTKPEGEPLKLWYTKILKEAGIAVNPDGSALSDPEVKAALDSNSAYATIWVGGITLTGMYSPLMGGWKSLAAAYEAGKLPDIVYDMPAMMVIAGQVYRNFYNQESPTDAEIRALIGNRDNMADMGGDPALGPASLRRDPTTGDIVDLSGEVVAKANEPSAFRLFAEAGNIGNPNRQAAAVGKLGTQFGFIPTGTPGVTPEQAAKVRERQAFTRYEGMEDPHYSSTVNSFLDAITNNPGDTINMFGELTTYTQNPTLLRDYLKGSLGNRPDIGPEDRQRIARSLDALDLNNPEDVAVLRSAANDLLDAYTQALSIYNARVESPK